MSVTPDSWGLAMYPWPFGEFDNVMDEALSIAMDYLVRADQAVNFRLALRREEPVAAY
jgi:hypothetical protein